MNNTELKWLGFTLVERSRMKLCLSYNWPWEHYAKLVKNKTSQKSL